MELGRAFSVRKLKRMIPSRSRLAIFALICTNAVTVLTLYSNIPGMSLPQMQNDEEARRAGHSVQRKFERGHGLQGFVFYSAYRISPSEFVAIGLSALVLHNMMKTEICRWKRPDQSVVKGRVVVNYPGDAHKKTYEVALLMCTLEEDVSSQGGGQLYITIDREEVAVYKERPGSKHPIRPSPPYKSKLTYCSSPIYGDINEDRVMEWIEYHRVTHGIDYFHLYDAGGISSSLRTRLKPYRNARIMSLTDVREINEFETWLYAQLLVVNDCAYRTRFTSQWALFMDLDEYLYVTDPPHSIQPILDKNKGKMWVTFGSMFYYTDKCTHSANVSDGMPQPWHIERLVFRQTEVHCKNVAKYGNRTHCLEYDGHRKYIIDPRQITVCGIHKVVRPIGGLHTSTDEVHLNHFRGVNTRSVEACKQYIYDTDKIPPSWTRDYSLARAAHAARLPGF